MARLLILGGTTEARALAGHASEIAGLEVVTALAGRTLQPLHPAGEVRIGGFGGPDGLADYLRAAAIDFVIDATHPFAAIISRNAAGACAAAAVPRLLLVRPPWYRQPGDHWIEVADMNAAAAALPSAGKRAFLAIGRKELDHFAPIEGGYFLVRSVDALVPPPGLADMDMITARGPFALADEIALLRENAIDVVVSKNSGGEGAYGKIAAARDLGLKVILVARPEIPAGETAASVTDAHVWLQTRLG